MGHKPRALALATGLLLAAAAGARLYDSPDETTLWLEDFRGLEIAADPTAGPGWAFEDQPWVLEETADGLRLAAAAGRQMQGRLFRELPLDLEVERTVAQYPYLILEVSQVEGGVFGGVSLTDADPLQPTALLERADRAGRYVLDLRQLLPRRVGMVGTLPLQLAAYGATAAGPGPFTTLRSLRLASEAPDRIDVTSTSHDGVIRRGDTVTIQVHTAAPAQAARLTLAVGTPRRGFSFDGRANVDLLPVGDAGTTWRVDLPVDAAGTSVQRRGSSVLLTVDLEGGPVPRLLTSLPFDLDTTGTPPPVRSVAVPLVSAAPILDGRLDEDAWSHCTPTGGFRTGAGEPATPGTSVRICRTMDTFYIAVTADEPAMGDLRGSAAERDAAMDADDSLQLVFWPRSAGARYEFQVNTIGTMADRKAAEGERVNVEWDTDWAAVTERGAQSWTTEFAIPIAVFELANGSDEEWGFNVERIRCAGGQPERTWWVPAPEAAGRLTGLRLDPSPFQMELSAPRVVTTRGLDVLNCNFEMDVTNRTGRQVELQALCAVQVEGTGRGLQATLVQQPDEHDVLQIPLVVPSPGRYEFYWRLFAPGQPRLIATGRRTFTIEYQALTATWAPPLQDGVIYPNSGVTDAVASVTFDSGGKDGLLLTGRLLAGDRQVATHSLLTQGTTAQLSLPVAALEPGAYLLEVTLRDGERELARANLAIDKRPGPRPMAVALDPSGLVEVAGELLLPVAWSDGPPPPGLPFAVQIGRLTPAEAPEEVLVVHRLDDLVAAADEARTGPLSDATRESLRRAVAAVRESPMLFGYLLADTPELLPLSPEYLQQVRALVAEEDPTHPCLLLARGPAGVRSYAASADIVIAAVDASWLPGTLEAAGGKPVWLHLPVGASTPMALLRSQAHQGLLLGARGLVFSAPGGLGEQQQAALAALREQLLGLTPAFLGESLPDLQVAPPVLLFARRPASGLVVVVTNPTAQPQELSLRGLPADRLELDGTPVQAPEGRLVDRLAPYEVRVYFERR